MTRSRRIALGAFAFHGLAPLGASWIALDRAHYGDVIALVLLGGIDLPLAPLYWLFCDGVPWGGRVGPYRIETAACLSASFVFGGLFYAWAAVRLDRVLCRLFR